MPDPYSIYVNFVAEVLTSGRAVEPQGPRIGSGGISTYCK